jgi:transcriptional regulator with XRE-family HTH domain
MSLGEKIRSLRRRRGLTVQGLASACSLSKGFISQVENGRTSPSLSTLTEMARVLCVSPAVLLANGAPGAPGAHVTRANGRKLAGAPVERSASTVSLCDRPGRSLDLFMVEIPPGSSLGGDPIDESGEQAVHVLSGRVRIGYGQSQVELGPGDTGHWEVLPGITVTNLGSEPARLMLAALSAVMPAGEAAEH